MRKNKKMLVKRIAVIGAAIAVTSAMFATSSFAHTTWLPTDADAPTMQLQLAGEGKGLFVEIGEGGTTLASFEAKKINNPILNLWAVNATYDIPLGKTVAGCPTSADVNQIVQVTVAEDGHFNAVLEYDAESKDGSTQHASRTLVEKTDPQDVSKTYQIGICSY